MLSVGFYSSSEEDDEILTLERMHRKRNAQKASYGPLPLRREFNVFSLPHKKFVGYFRLNKEAFKYVLKIICPKLRNPKKNFAVSKLVKLTATLRILAEGSYQKGAGNDINVNLCQSSVSDEFHECIEAMYSELCPRWISFLMDEEEKKLN